MKQECTICEKPFKPQRKLRKNIVCPKCKDGKKLKCTECGKIAKSKKNDRKKTFLCSGCAKDYRKTEKLLKTKKTIDAENIKEFLLEKEFVLSKTGIPYKHYGNKRVSLGNACSLPLLVVSSRDSSDCYIDSSIEKVLSKEILLELKVVINTIITLWKTNGGSNG